MDSEYLNSPEAQEAQRQAEIASYQERIKALDPERAQLDSREAELSEQYGPGEISRLKELLKKAGKEAIVSDLTALSIEEIKRERHEEQYRERSQKFSEWLQENNIELGEFNEVTQELIRIDLLRDSFGALNEQLWKSVVERRDESEKLKRLEEFIEQGYGDEMPLEAIVFEAFEKNIEDLPPHIQERIEAIRADHPEIMSLEDIEGFNQGEEEE